MVMQPSRIHGGPDSRGVPLYDFSTNSNGCGPCPQALAALQGVDLTRYPDPGYTDLRAALASFHGVDAQRVVLAASGSEFVVRITSWVRGQGGRCVWVPHAGYGDYAQAALAHGLELASSSADGADLAWACDPSSPVGQTDPELACLRAATVVLDRAYEPLRLAGSLALDEERIAACWQLWTPNKALGLTGVRAAYGIAPVGAHEAVAQLEALAPSWPLGAHGVAMLRAWCDPAVQQWLSQSLDTLRKWKRRQLALCESLGWECLPSHTNFFVARIPGPSLEQLRERGIKLRDCASFGMPGHARLSVQSPAAQDALKLACEELMR